MIHLGRIGDSSDQWIFVKHCLHSWFQVREFFQRILVYSSWLAGLSLNLAFWISRKKLPVAKSRTGVIPAGLSDFLALTRAWHDKLICCASGSTDSEADCSPQRYDDNALNIVLLNIPNIKNLFQLESGEPKLFFIHLESRHHATDWILQSVWWA